MELEVTWGRAVRVWWAYLWRNLVAVIVAIVVGAVLGGIIGFVLGIAGASKETVQIITMPIGFIIGLAFSVVPIKLILGKNFGEFRLLLISRQVDAQQGAAPDRYSAKCCDLRSGKN